MLYTVIIKVRGKKKEGTCRRGNIEDLITSREGLAGALKGNLDEIIIIFCDNVEFGI